MREGKGSFWSSVPGIVTGLAGLLTAVVGLITVLIQSGVLGHSAKTTTTTILSTSPSTVPGPTTTLAAPATTAPAGTFVVDPKSIDFPVTDLGPKSLKLTNTSASTSLIVQTPKVDGLDMSRFTAAYDTCSSAPLRPGASCTLKVTFTPAPGSALRRYTASLDVAAMGAPSGYSIDLTATTLL